MRVSALRAAIHDAMNSRSFDEIVISTLPKRVSKWLHLDLPSKARGLGLQRHFAKADFGVAVL